MRSVRILGQRLGAMIGATLGMKLGRKSSEPFAPITVCLLLGICIIGADVEMGPPIFAQVTDHTAQGWFLAGSKPEYYRTGVDPKDYEGQSVSFLRDSLPETNGYGTLMQTVEATPYLGKRLRLRAFIKSDNVEDWAGLWMRVDKKSTTVAFDNMHSRAIKGTQPWAAYDVVLDVPADATNISFGILLSGSGQVEMSRLSVEPVGAETEVTAARIDPPSKTQVSPDFTY